MLRVHLEYRSEVPERTGSLSSSWNEVPEHLLQTKLPLSMKIACLVLSAISVSISNSACELSNSIEHVACQEL